jgi:hypothetical protein
MTDGSFALDYAFSFFFIFTPHPFRSYFDPVCNPLRAFGYCDRRVNAGTFVTSNE